MDQSDFYGENDTNRKLAGRGGGRQVSNPGGARVSPTAQLTGPPAINDHLILINRHGHRQDQPICTRPTRENRGRVATPN